MEIFTTSMLLIKYCTYNPWPLLSQPSANSSTCLNLCFIFSAWGNLPACFLFLCILRSLNKSYLFNNSVLSISCLQNNHEPSLVERVTLLLKATDRETHKKPDITCRLCFQWAQKETKARGFTDFVDALHLLIYNWLFQSTEQSASWDL